MLIDVEAFLLNTLRNTETDSLLNRPEEDDASDDSPAVDDEDTKSLCAKEAEAVTVEAALRDGEDTCEQGSKDTTDTVNRACAGRVVNMELLVDEGDREWKDDTADSTDGYCTGRRDSIAACGDAYQAGKDTVQRQ